MEKITTELKVRVALPWYVGWVRGARRRQVVACPEGGARRLGVLALMGLLDISDDGSEHMFVENRPSLEPGSSKVMHDCCQ